MALDTSNAPADEFDDLFNYSVDMQDVFLDANVTMDAPVDEQPAPTKSRDENLGLGIDEEVKVTKRRASVPKLDENRLLSQAGIPKLRRLAKERLRFKGKSHEYSDLACLLNVYQFWLDDLYPRAKFADGLTIIEKLGHSKRIQAMRREWINEGKPRSRFEDTDLLQDSRRITKGSETARPDSIATSANQTFENSNMRHPSASAEEDLYKATPPRRKQTTGYDSVIESTSMDQTPPKDADADVPDDDLDILLAETSWTRKRDAPPVLASANQEDATQFSNEDDFDDEMEVMAEMRMNGA